MSDHKIETETHIEHQVLGDALKEWAEEVGLDQLGPEERSILMGVFRDGWGLCLHHSMRPARDLAMMLLQMAALAERQGDCKVLLGHQALDAVRDLCHRIIGRPTEGQLDDFVELVQTEPPRESED